jgi:Haemolymph juvenile hormone binding protein (JHBP)
MHFCSVIEYASKYTFQIELPHLYVVGRYVVDGRILFLPIKGNGKFSGNFTGGTGDVRIKGIHKEINGQTHFIVNKMDIKVNVKRGKLDLDNLFGGDKTLGEVINQTINTNFEVFSKEIIPLIEKSLSKIFKRTANKILERFTLAQLFP